MIYTGLNHTGEVQEIHTHGGGTVEAVYGGINYQNPIFYSRKTLAGTIPLSYKALSKPLSDYLISGNILQNGTPTPQAPVDVVGCGVRTENLLPSTLTRYEFAIESVRRRIVEFPGAYMYIIPTNGREYFTLKIYNPGVTVNVVRLALYDKPVPQAEIIEYVEEAMNTENPKITIHNVNNSPYLIIQIGSQYANQYGITGVMLNFGSTPLPYEPYGYKLPVTIGGTEYPIYLGQVPTTRRVKKLVLDGTESWTYRSGEPSNIFFIEFIGAHFINNSALCTHYLNQDSGRFNELADKHILTLFRNDGTKSYIGLRDSSFPSGHLSELKEYLAAQYAAGTPVTVWYVLAEPETGIINEPLHKIGNYADAISMAQAGVTIPTVAGANTLTIDTTVQPSAVSITGNIKPTGYGQLLDVNDVDIQDSTGEPVYIQG